MKTHHWDVFATFHRDVVGCFIGDVAATSPRRLNAGWVTLWENWMLVKVLAFLLCTPAKKIKKNLFKVLAVSWYILKKMKIFKMLTFLIYTGKNPQSFEKRACFLFIFFEAIQNFVILAFPFSSYVLKNQKRNYVHIFYFFVTC